MQLFSRNKALIAVTLGALTALGACGDDVTVPVAPITPVTLSITPPSASMNVGESLNFAVQINGGSTTTPPTLQSCASSNAAVLTAAIQGTACRVTAVAAGNATVTATATTGQSAAASISVAAPAASISNLTLSPSTSNIAVNQTVTIVPNVQRAANAVTVTYAYTSSSASVATVTAAGVVTAVAPGVATITVTASGSGAGFSNATLTGAATVTVTALPQGITALNVQPASLAIALGQTAQLSAAATQPAGAAAAGITYGTSVPSVATVSATGLVTAVAPGTAVITVTATSAANTNFAAATLTQLVPVTVSPAAQVIISSLTDNGAVIDITNVAGQFEVNLQLQPNGQNVSSVQTFVCEQGEAQAACIARGPAAQQTFGSAGGQAGPIQLLINSAEFTTPNFATGADANTLYKNGLKTMIATVTTSPANSGISASNNLSQINFNNEDGWTIQWTQPTNRANSAAGITWYGGPTTPDALNPGSTSGLGSFVVVPVLYTPNRTIATATLGINGLVCGSSILDSTRPFAGTYGDQARSTTSVAFRCNGAVSTTDGYVPAVTASVDNNNAAGPVANGGTILAATSIYTPISAAAISSPTFAGRYRQSLAFRPTTIYIPGDYEAPVVSSFDVRGGGGTSVDSGWVNADYAFNQVINASTGATRYQIADGSGVGLFPTASRNTVFDICPIPATISGTAATTCTTPVASGPLNSTVGSLNLPENATNFTNEAYFAIARETDRLGNRSATNPFAFTPSGGSLNANTPAGSRVNPQSFGVDLTAPAVVAIPNATGTNVNPLFANFARTDLDSIYSTLGNTYGTTNASNAVFALRFNDTRSGFFQCVAGTNCPAQTGGATVNAGTFQIARRTLNAQVSLTNDAVVENIIRTTASARQNVINAVIGNADPSNRDFTINIFGEAARVPTSPVLTRAPAASVAGYYTFTGTLVDRAGNTTTITPRSVAIDNEAPRITGIQVPAILQGATTVAFVPAGTDDLEAIAGDLGLAYPQIAVEAGVNNGQPTRIRFRRVPNFSSTAVLGLWHNPFQSLTDNKLTSPVGPGLALSSMGLTVPIPFIQQIQTVDVNSAPLVPNTLTAVAMKPTSVSAWLYDIRSTTTSAGTPGSLFAITGISSILTSPLFDGQITQPATAKNWTATAVAGTQAPVGIQGWFGFNIATPNSVEFRVSTSTSVTNPPFTRVEMIRAGVGEWTHLGQAVFAGSLDQGATRFWRYTFSFSGVSQGQGMVAALANLDVLRAIGVDAAGNALSTNNTTVGGAVNAVTSVAVTPAGPIFVPTSGGTYQLAGVVTQAPGAVTAALSYALLSTSGMTVVVSPNGAVTITGGFVAGSSAIVRVSATAPTSIGFIGNTVNADVQFVSGVTGITAVAITGTIPTTLQPGASFTLTAVPSQPMGAPAATYAWIAPAGFDISNAAAMNPTFTWNGTQSIVNGNPVISVIASSAQFAPGFSAGSAPNSVTTAVGAFNGFTNADAFSLALSGIQQSINAGGTNALTLTPTFASDVANNSTACSSGNTTAATISNAGVITANAVPNSGFLTAANVSFACTLSRTFHLFAGVNYAARSVSSNTVTALILPFGVQTLALAPSTPATVLIGQTFAITATTTTAMGGSSPTITTSAVTGAGTQPTLSVAGNVITISAVGATAGTYTFTVTATAAAVASTTAGNAITSATYTVIVQ